jgi:ferritin-like metal-binding protein YciE
MSADNLRELLVDQMKDIYDAEHRITKALPKMAKAADSPQLKMAFETHLRETEEQIRRLEQAFDILDESAKKKECKATIGLLQEGEEAIDQDDPNVRDAAMIAAAQKVEHYEMAAYGCLRTWAELLGEDEAAGLFQTTLDEEGETDKKLTEVSRTLNVEAIEDDERMGTMSEEEEGEKVPVRAQKRNPRN